MAAIDYTSVIIKEGIPVESIKVGPYEFVAYRGYLLIVNAGLDNPINLSFDSEKIPELTDAHKISLISKKDINKFKRLRASFYAKTLNKYEMISKVTHKPVSINKVFCKYWQLLKYFKNDALDLYIYRIADSIIIYFPDSPAFGGASYAYILTDDNTLSVIASGYGHYQNPTLHWINRDLSKEAEGELIQYLWKEMTDPRSLSKLLIEQRFNNAIYHYDGGYTFEFGKNTRTDPAIIRLYQVLKIKKIKI